MKLDPFYTDPSVRITGVRRLMTLSDLGNIGEIVGGIGVIASLMYLAIQIRKNDKSTRAATTQALLGRSTEMIMQQTYSGFDPESASRLQLENLFFGIISHMNNAHYQRSIGILDDEAWAMFDSRLKRLVQSLDNFEDWWERYRGDFTPSFVDYVNEILSV